MKRNLILCLSVMLLWSCSSKVINSSSSKSLQDGYEACNLGDYFGAVQAFTKCIDLDDSQKMNCLYGRSWVSFEMFDFTKCLDDANVIVQMKVNDPAANEVKGNAYWLMGRVYSKLNELEKGIYYLDSAIAYTQHSYLYSTRGWERVRMKDFEGAKEDFSNSLKLDSTNAYAYNNRALAFIGTNELELAQKDILKSYSLDSDNSYLYKHWALLNIAQGEAEQACYNLNRAIEKGYRNFGGESDGGDVDSLLQKYCQD